MDIQFRLVLLVVGILILTGVVIDFLRRRPNSKQQRGNEMHSELFGRRKFEHTAIEPEPEIGAELESQMDPELELSAEYEPYNYDLEYESTEEPTVVPKPEPKASPRVISIYIISRERFGFKGADLLSAATSAHFYFGKNDVFHRYEHEDGSGELLFSLIKAHEPGYFYIDLLKQEHVSGIALIMLPENLQNPQQALDKLIRAAKQMAFALNGELLDNNREALTLTTINNYTAQIKTNANR